MDDKHVQEWGGVLPAPPTLICFLHWIYIAAWTLYEQPQSCDPFHQQLLRLCRFHFTWEHEFWQKQQKPQLSNEIQNIHAFHYTQLSGFICSRTFLIFGHVFISGYSQHEGTEPTHRSCLARAENKRWQWGPWSPSPAQAKWPACPSACLP